MAGAEHPCSICMEPMAPSKVHRGGGACAHAFCRACLSGHVRAKVETGTGAVVRCPDPSCAGALDPELCRVALPSDVFERWCAKLCESMFLGARRTYCPFPDCSEMMVADAEGCVTQSECQVCRRLFCTRCGVAPWHAGMTCDEYQRLARGDRGREDMMLYEMAQGISGSCAPIASSSWRKSLAANTLDAGVASSFATDVGHRGGQVIVIAEDETVLWKLHVC